MAQPRIIHLLKALNPQEIRRFVSFVESPFFNQNVKLTRLAKHLMKVFPDFKEEEVANQRLFYIAYGKDEPYEEQWVYDHLSQLRKLLEQFLAQLEYDQDPAGQSRYLLRSLSERDLADVFPKIAGKAEKQLVEPEKKNAQYFLNHFRIQELQVSHLQRARKRAVDGKAESMMTEMVESLDQFYLATKLKLSCEMRNRSRIVNTEYPFPLMQEIIQALSKPGQVYLATPVISIYLTIYRMLTEEAHAAAYFRELVDLLEKYGETFARAEAVAMYAFAQNFCVRQINRGQNEYHRELFQLYQRMLSREVLIESDGYLAHWNYKNIATVGLRLGDEQWVLSFIEAYRDSLDPANRDNAYNYNLAAYYYETKAYPDAMKLLQQVEFTDIYYHLSAKSILLKIYFELEEEDSMSYLMLAFGALLRRNRHISRSQVEVYENFLRFVRQLHRLRGRIGSTTPQKMSAQIEDLRQKIEQAESVANKNWLKEKLEELLAAVSSEEVRAK